MKKSVFNKLLALSLLLTIVACKGQQRNGKTTKKEELTSDSTATKSTEQITEKSKTIDNIEAGTADEKSAREISKGGNEIPASQHKAPAQEKIDSLKQHRTNSKRKRH